LHPSRFEWISEGLKDLWSILLEKNIQSVALPALGCGNGGLEWDLVKAEIDSSLAGLDIRILVYEARP
jgi:O-acetyl-ADP-ribose deacetylase (regulator of RNase III)